MPYIEDNFGKCIYIEPWDMKKLMEALKKANEGKVIYK